MDEKMMELTPEMMNDVTGGAMGSKTKLPDKDGCIVYKVKPGDTLHKISKEYFTTTNKIMAVNAGIITNANMIRDGYYIYIPRAK